MTNEIAQKLKIPAIGLIVVGILNILVGLLFLYKAIVVGYTGVTYQNFNEQDKFAFNIGLYGVMILGVLSLLVAPVIIYGAMKMMRGEKSSWAKIAAIFAMIPLTSCSFLIGVPFGIWALMILSKFKELPNTQNEIEQNDLKPLS